MFRIFCAKVDFIFLKIKENYRKLEFFEEYFFVHKWRGCLDLLNILNKTLHLEKVVFKDTCAR